MSQTYEELCQEYIRKLLEHEVRRNPTPLMEDTPINGVFRVRRDVGDIGRLLRVSIAEYLPDPVASGVINEAVPFESGEMVVLEPAVQAEDPAGSLVSPPNPNLQPSRPRRGRA